MQRVRMRIRRIRRTKWVRKRKMTGIVTTITVADGEDKSRTWNK